MNGGRISERLPPQKNGGGVELRRRTSKATVCTISSEAVVQVGFSLTDLTLGFALQLFGLSLDLLAGIAGETTDRVAHFALELVPEAFALVLEPVPVEIVRHCVLRLGYLTVQKAEMPSEAMATAVPSLADDQAMGR